MVKVIPFTVVAGLLLACANPASHKDTGGVQLDASSGCPAGIAAILGDRTYQSSQVALSALDGTVLSASFISSASAQTDGLAFALSGDTALPTTPPASGRVVVIDRYGTNVITWVDQATAKVQGQLSVGTGFESNPQDYLELDETRALVSRWGVNGTPNQQPFDVGSDLLVIDTRTPSIVASLAIPPYDAAPSNDNLPPRPAELTQVGASVAVVLQRISQDFKSVGDAEIVRFDTNSLSVAQHLRLAGMSNCGRLMPRPDSGYAMACTGPLDAYGASADLSRTGLVLFGVADNGDLVEQVRIRAPEITGEPLQAQFDFASHDIALVKTQTQQGGSTNNRLLAIDLASHGVTPLVEAHPGSDGTGQGLTYGSVICTPGCSPVCLLADGDQGVLRRFDMSQTPAVELPSIDVSSGVGLLPRQLARF
jgi:hypothetical protein